MHSLLTFFLPLTLAVVGVWLAGDDASSQLAGGLFGLLGGMAIVRLYAVARSRSRGGET